MSLEICALNAKIKCRMPSHPWTWVTIWLQRLTKTQLEMQRELRIKSLKFPKRWPLRPEAKKSSPDRKTKSRPKMSQQLMRSNYKSQSLRVMPAQKARLSQVKHLRKVSPQVRPMVRLKREAITSIDHWPFLARYC